MPLCTLTIVAAVMVPMAIALPASAHPVFDLKACCKQLVSFYDRYGASHTENSDGRCNHTRIGADIDCKEGNRQDGVAAMIKLLESKRFDVPSASDTAQAAANASRSAPPPELASLNQ